MAKTPVKNTTMKPTKAKKSTTMLISKAGYNFATKRLLPLYSAYETGRAIKEKRYGDAVNAAAWLTVPTGIAYETSKFAYEQSKGKPIPKGAQVRFGLTPQGKPRGR